MATVWDPAFDELARVGFFDIVLPFILIFALIHHLLTHVDPFRSTNTNTKNIYRMLAFTISFIAIASVEIIGAVSTVAIYGVSALMAMVILAIVFGAMGVQPDEVQWPFWVIMAIAGLGLLYMFFDLDGIVRGLNIQEALPLIIMLATFLAITRFVTGGEEADAISTVSAGEAGTQAPQQQPVQPPGGQQPQQQLTPEQRQQQRQIQMQIFNDIKSQIAAGKSDEDIAQDIHSKTGGQIPMQDLIETSKHLRREGNP